MGSCGCGEHWRTLENAQEEILHNSISPLGPNPEVHAGNFLYIRWRKTVVGLQQKIFLFTTLTHKTTTIPMLSMNQPTPSEMCQQVEEMKRVWEAQEKEE